MLRRWRSGVINRRGRWMMAAASSGAVIVNVFASAKSSFGGSVAELKDP